jgi:hypothetical protein
MEVRSIEGK